MVCAWSGTLIFWLTTLLIDGRGRGSHSWTRRRPLGFPSGHTPPRSPLRPGRPHRAWHTRRLWLRWLAPRRRGRGPAGGRRQPALPRHALPDGCARGAAARRRVAVHRRVRLRPTRQALTPRVRAHRVRTRSLCRRRGPPPDYSTPRRSRPAHVPDRTIPETSGPSHNQVPEAPRFTPPRPARGPVRGGVDEVRGEVRADPFAVGSVRLPRHAARRARSGSGPVAVRMCTRPLRLRGRPSAWPPPQVCSGRHEDDRAHRVAYAHRDSPYR